MFFRREKPRVPTFADRLQRLADAGFQVERQPDGAAKAGRDVCAALVHPVDGGPPRVEKAGILLQGEIAWVVDAGYQKFLQTPTGRTAPALASHLKALHAFEEDLREGLGLVSLYNESLGTTNDLHMYDRVAGRDRGAPKPWDR